MRSRDWGRLHCHVIEWSGRHESRLVDRIAVNCCLNAIRTTSKLSVFDYSIRYDNAITCGSASHYHLKSQHTNFLPHLLAVTTTHSLHKLFSYCMTQWIMQFVCIVIELIFQYRFCLKDKLYILFFCKIANITIFWLRHIVRRICAVYGLYSLETSFVDM